MKSDTALDLDPALLWDWLAARSLARGLSAPVADRGGMRVDTGSADEIRRHVFAGPAPGIVELAAAIHSPRIFIKMCGPGEQLLALAPPRWRLQPPGFLMTQAAAPGREPALPPGYRIEVSREGAAFAAAIFAPDGARAAGGYALEHGRAFVFDRIATHPDHRRRGLGRAIMTALGSLQASSATTRVLVATEQGRALYASLGWTTVSPWSTIVIPDWTPDAGAAKCAIQ